MLAEDDRDVVTLSEIEHYAYCARQWALIHLDGVWVENEPTSVGQLVHRRVDEPERRHERGRSVVRGLVVWSDTHGLLGRADAVEFTPGLPPFPVEHKSGRKALGPARLQLAGQAICLGEMFGTVVTRGAVWLHGQRHRRDVEITDEQKQRTLEVVGLIRRSRDTSGLPPAVFDSRCPDCSLIDECLPRLVTDRRRALALHHGLFDPGPGPLRPTDA